MVTEMSKGSEFVEKLSQEESMKMEEYLLEHFPPNWTNVEGVFQKMCAEAEIYEKYKTRGVALVWIGMTEKLLEKKAKGNMQNLSLPDCVYGIRKFETVFGLEEKVPTSKFVYLIEADEVRSIQSAIKGDMHSQAAQYASDLADLTVFYSNLR